MTSEVFLGPFTKLATSVGNEAQWRSWVFKIADRRMVDHILTESRLARPDALEALGDH